MIHYTIQTDPTTGEQVLTTNVTGKALLTIPQLNKGTAFSHEERDTFHLTGKLPARVENLGEQIVRAYIQYLSYDEKINRNIYLNNLLNTNQILFYGLIKKYIQEMLPTIYTPIVGSAVTSYNKKFTQPRGLYINYEDIDRIDEILDNRSNQDIRLIVVSDGEGVLGIGDQGVGAMAIPVAKLMVYSAFGGIDPLTTLPILLDAGTNNQDLLEDPLYLGWRAPRLSGEQYQRFIKKFVDAILRKFPHVFLHWEDFGRTNAYKNLMTYRKMLCTFNDDIQGTGVVALAAALAACKQTKTPLTQQRIIIFGAGTAGMGVVESLCQGMVKSGLSIEAARKQFWLIDRPGLVTELSEDHTSAQAHYIRSAAETKDWAVKNKQNITLLEVIQTIKPTMLIGTSAKKDAFTREHIEAMLEHTDRPIVFPLSNPTDRCEASPHSLIHWTKGRALIATGSPFSPVHFEGKTFTISQCNNYLAFPGIGLGVLAIFATQLTDNMLFAASAALSEYTKDGTLLPGVSDVEAASKDIAIAVANAAVRDGVCGIPIEKPIETYITQTQWHPRYLAYQPANKKNRVT